MSFNFLFYIKTYLIQMISFFKKNINGNNYILIKELVRRWKIRIFKITMTNLSDTFDPFI